MATEARVTVRRTKWEVTNIDLGFVHGAHRGGAKAGRVFRLSVTGERGARSLYIVLRGLPNDSREDIWLDKWSRDHLGVRHDQPYTFNIREAGFVGQLCWAWNANDPAYRVSAKLGVLSLALGLLSLVLTLPFLF